ncbi:MAG: ATP-binding cassette domain-containing protein [Candidatus Limivivens sp.]|nr:ATP-binding cassette domain-containing protein [Candidatus Limivivens sp.]
MIIRNLSKSYDQHPVLENLNLTLPEGGIYALMGPSGSGKTTLLHILLGLVKPDSGFLEGLEGKRFSAVFQENRLCGFLTAAENLAIVSPSGGSAADYRSVLAEILPTESLNQKTDTYSGGMKRRTAIARAMVVPSDILIMDEPFTGLDEETKEQVVSFILRYRKGRTLIFSTHDPEDVPAFQARKILL